MVGNAPRPDSGANAIIPLEVAFPAATQTVGKSAPVLLPKDASHAPAADAVVHTTGPTEDNHECAEYCCD